MFPSPLSLMGATKPPVSIPSITFTSTDSKKKNVPTPDNLMKQTTARSPCPTQRLASLIYTLYLFTRSDIITFVAPTASFGILAALSPLNLTTSPSPPLFTILSHIPQVITFVWTTLLLFNLSNQRTPAAAEEDRINKPHRPIPSGRLSCEDARRLTLIAVPTILALNHYLGAGLETLLIIALTYMHNDLRGAAELWLVRDGLTSLAFACFNHGSLKLALGGTGATITSAGYTWIAMVSGVILTTMSMQDLKDVAGDMTQGRKTLPIVCGSAFARQYLAFFILLWSVWCARFWAVSGVAVVGVVGMGAWVAWRILTRDDVKADWRSWKLWSLWLLMLYALPMVCRLQVATE